MTSANPATTSQAGGAESIDNRTSADPAATRIARDSHSISRKHISDGALKVMSRLRRHDHQAFLVGGAVRDLLMGGQPKDFDVATDATPEQVRTLFRNSIIIGRRFQIVHVRFGREVVEVTTFRGHHGSDTGDNRQSPAQHHSRQSDTGMLLRDNVFGSLEEDAARRDFTVNALYYCSADFCVYDYVGGWSDLQQRQIRVIGDAEQRYREDPVRMLRAVRFAAKLGFDIAEDTASSIPALAHTLEAVPGSRLFDEMIKLFMSGYALDTFRLLRKHRLLEHLYPASTEPMNDPATLALVEAAMRSTDSRVTADKPVTPAFVLAALLWAPVLRLHHQLKNKGMTPPEAMLEASQSILDEQSQHITIPRRFTTVTREIWELQPRLQSRRRPLAMLEQRRFRAAYDLLLLREECGEDLDGTGQFWTELQEKHPDITPKPAARKQPGRRPRRRGGRRGGRQ